MSTVTLTAAAAAESPWAVAVTVTVGLGHYQPERRGTVTDWAMPRDPAAVRVRVTGGPARRPARPTDSDAAGRLGPGAGPTVGRADGDRDGHSLPGWHCDD